MTATTGRIGTGSGATALQGLVAAQKRGEPLGIWSVCSAHPEVLRAAMDQAVGDGSALLVESTSNQVNPEGGYTGERPGDFVRRLKATAAEAGLPPERLILGGDHLGPFPWQAEPAAAALGKARELVRQCVLAGYEKIHLDASMACADDPGGAGGSLDERTVASAPRTSPRWPRSHAESAVAPDGPVYVVGTEVPTPAASRRSRPRSGRPAAKPSVVSSPWPEKRSPTAVSTSAWQRVIALVVQPGVEFGDTPRARLRSRGRAGASLEVEPHRSGLVYEAHSTDYQTESGASGASSGTTSRS